MFRRLNKALPELLLGIFIYGIVIQAAGVWFSEDKLRYSSGLWIGILTAMAMAYHIALIIAESVDAVDPQKARTRIIAKGILRYVSVVIVFTVTMYFDLGNLITLFIGVMGLKISAYLQPTLHKVLIKVTEKGGGSSDETNSMEREVKM
ncbi:hypothetical protein C823_005539 [Eubacterium plexicaudatum ASF492]|uniref:ATP synthase I n=1 Tax=Eubacterium plexicaudatum ASF492 TaxID=1235802 RepID=N2B5U4_9FIRM|nr:hypothetical protein C823_005539 [Eubacterium plexicaudatum ASF492]